MFMHTLQNETWAGADQGGAPGVAAAHLSFQSKKKTSFSFEDYPVILHSFMEISEFP